MASLHHGSTAPIIGSSSALRKAVARAEKVAPSTLSVLVLGESGTGKELLARHIHARSARATGPFVAINCAAIPRELLESVLFGHEKGSFTGALARKDGAFQRAHGGTLFLDEIADLAPEHQTKVLRALQDGEIEPVGAVAARRVDVRVVAATSRDLDVAKSDGRFREDLYYRVAGFLLHLPPLRERGRDVLLIAKAILGEQHPGKLLSRASEAALLQYPWPGNIRELQNVVRAAAVMARGKRIDVSALPAMLREQAPLPTTNAAAVARLREMVERQGSITPAEARAVLRLGRTCTFEVLRELEDAGLVERRGKGRATSYMAVAAPSANGATRDAVSRTT